MYRFILTFIMLNLFLVTGGMSEEPDVKLRKHLTFKLASERDGSHSLESETTLYYQLLSKRAAENQGYSIPESYFAPVKKIKAKYGKKSVKKERITIHNVEAKDVFLSDNKFHLISFPDDMKRGTEIQYSYRRTYKDIVFLPIVDIPNVNELMELIITYEHPDHFRLEFEAFFPADTVAYSVNRLSKKKTTVRFGSISYRQAYSYFDYNHIHASILPRVFINDIELTRGTPESFSEWYKEKLRYKSATPQRPLVVPAELAKTDQSQLEYARTLYDYVRKNIRYLADVRGTSAYVPNRADKTLKNAYGDCKDKAFLISQIAQQNGVPIQMALISTDPRPEFNSTHIWQYNHVICALSYQDSTYFFDPTSSHTEFGNLPEYDSGKKVLILDDQQPRLVKTPLVAKLPSISIRIVGVMDSLKNADAEITLRNDFFAYASRARQSLTGVRFENAVTELISDYFYKLSIDYFKPIKETESTIVLQATADLSKFIIQSPSKIYVPRTPFLIVEGEVLKRREDDFPIYLEERPHFEMTLDLDLAGTETSEKELIFGNISDTYFKSTAERIEQGKMRFYSLFEQTKKEFRGKEKDAFLSFCQTYLSGKKSMFIIRKGEK